jgi:hypothetical protein
MMVRRAMLTANNAFVAVGARELVLRVVMVVEMKLGPLLALWPEGLTQALPLLMSVLEPAGVCNKSNRQLSRKGRRGIEGTEAKFGKHRRYLQRFERLRGRRR